MSTLAENMDLEAAEILIQDSHFGAHGQNGHGHDEELLLAFIYNQIERAEESCFRLKFYLDELKA